jgi:hypothetical protein
MRHGVTSAAHHAAHRKAFGKYLIDQPLMRNVLADLAIESEAATITMLRLAGATDRSVRGDESETAFKRLALAVSKYWICKRWPAHAAESLECLGGNGYVEESGMPRLFRESPLNSIWEGSGNVAALDVLRAMAKEPQTIEAYFAEVGRPTPASTPPSGRSRPPWPTWTPSNSAPAASSNAWRSPCRRPSCSGTATRRSPPPSAPPAWPATGAPPTAPSLRGWTSPRSSTEQPRNSADPGPQRPSRRPRSRRPGSPRAATERHLTPGEADPERFGDIVTAPWRPRDR